MRKQVCDCRTQEYPSLQIQAPSEKYKILPRRLIKHQLKNHNDKQSKRGFGIEASNFKMGS